MYDESPRLHKIDLMSGEISIHPEHAFSCFFIVQHMNDKLFIDQLGQRLLLAGCKDYTFYGEREPLWHLLFDEADILLNPDAEEDIAMTSGSSTLEDFADELDSALSWHREEPYDIFLLYDDRDLCEIVLSLLQDQKE